MTGNRESLVDKRVTVLGLGIEGVDLVRYLASHRASVTVSDMVFVAQGVPLTLPVLEQARERGVPISSMTRLFLELCPGPVIGITGSSGKTTTTSLLGAMFAATGRPHAMGGNIGVGLLGLLDELTPETWVVAEISHTQLEL